MPQAKESFREKAAMVAVFGVLMVMAFTAYAKLSKPINVNIDGLNQLKVMPFTNEVSDFLLVAKRFKAMHEYNKTGYNCQNYTHDLNRLAQSLGFKTQMVRGCPGNYSSANICHQWLKVTVDFEPQEGEFTDYSNQYPNQEVIP